MCSARVSVLTRPRPIPDPTDELALRQLSGAKRRGRLPRPDAPASSLAQSARSTSQEGGALLGAELAQPFLGAGGSELARALVPAAGLLGVGIDAAQLEASELDRVIGGGKRHRRLRQPTLPRHARRTAVLP